MDGRTVYRLHDIVDAIDQIDQLLEGKSFADLQADRVVRAAFERFLEILSEASRHIPDELKSRDRTFRGAASETSAIISGMPIIEPTRKFCGISMPKAN